MLYWLHSDAATNTHLAAIFRDYPGEPVAER